MTMNATDVASDTNKPTASAVGRLLNGLGQVAAMCGRSEQACTHHEEALAITRAIENRRRIADSYNKPGRVPYNLGE
jgi:tetratricopeptide (TPR) repeat protein